MVDTGADQTVLMPTDAVRMGVEYRTLASAKGHALSGIGGKCKSFNERAIIVFSDDSNAQLVAYEIEISIAEKKAAQLRCASLLGRDVLHRLRMSYNFRKKKIVFTVTSADARVALDKRRANSLKARIEKLEPLPQ